MSKPGSKSDSGGIAIYIRNEYVYDDIFFLQSDDDILWLKISGSNINLENDLYLGLCYLVPQKRGSSPFLRETSFYIKKNLEM